MNEIFYSKEAQKFLLTQNSKISLKIINKISELPKGNVKKLEGKATPPLYRLRIGKIRVVYYVDDEVIRIVKIDYRGDIYK